MAEILDITLERDGHDQPWGFRLQGGQDVGTPLSIQRCLVGSPVYGVLKIGDILLKISRTDAKNVSHQQAAELFTNTGNQIYVQIKRGAVASAPVSAKVLAPPQRVPVKGGVALPGLATSITSPKKNLVAKATPLGVVLPQSPLIFQNSRTTPLYLTIQDQPYRTSPLIQPSVKVDTGLKMQSNRKAPTSLQDFTMKQKVTGSLQNVQQSFSGGNRDTYHPVMEPQGRQLYNNPIGLYSKENVKEIARLNEMGHSGLPASPSGLLRPNKIQQVVITPPKDYNPQDSATWLALQESDPTMADPEKFKGVTSLREHDPIYSEVYSAKIHQERKSMSPQPLHQQANQGDSCPQSPEQLRPGSPQRARRSPVADLLPAHFGGKTEATKREESRPQEVRSSSAVLEAALDGSNSIDSSSVLTDARDIPLFETNAIGGRKRIAQSASFNKLMMNVLGD